MAPRRTPPVTTRLLDETAERVRRNHEERMTVLEAQLVPKIIQDVQLPSAVNVVIAHGLGRRPMWVGPGCIRGAISVGMIRDVTRRDLTGLFNSAIDEKQVIVLRADGYSSTITVDVLVY